ncbi:DUF6442 family protein [Clostridium akagii]|uniref:DUF6442 family protein n=1 Tax=Clostridium akagii TaxID=91623 RepID=UPI0004798A0C|nr:DUF6442 family protein [Clostridium akagii]
MLIKNIDKDERATFIENKSFKYGYNFISIALLLDVVYRGIWLNQSSWDLLGIVMLSALPTTVYQYKQKIFTRSWKISILFLFIFTAILGVALAFILKKFS